MPPQYLIREFVGKMKNVRCEYGRLNGWTSTLQVALYIRLYLCLRLWYGVCEFNLIVNTQLLKFTNFTEGPSREI